MDYNDKGSVSMALDCDYMKCVNDIFNLPLPSTDKLIYIALAHYARVNNRSCPNYEALAKDASCSRREAITAVENLCTCKLITKEARGNGPNAYMVFPPNYYSELEASS